ncbi:unnamed protein product [Adineta steineri]|uniref:Uncharacterized protein n=1 Tax=Adineta steineri TaxID=433720 RepID=A0A813UBG6_9BILA|nr:unnamed protein product [Adineta steineri]
MANQTIANFLTLPVELVYRILDHQSDFTLILTTLKVGFKCIRAIGAQSLGDALQHNTALTTIDLWYNKIGHLGAQCLCNALQRNTTLTTLHLGYNKIGIVGAQIIGIALQHNRTLATLELSFNEIGDVGGQCLGSGLQHNTTLTTLNLKGNNIRRVGAQFLVDALQRNTTLTKLDVGDNAVGRNAMLVIKKLLKENENEFEYNTSSSFRFSASEIFIITNDLCNNITDCLHGEDEHDIIYKPNIPKVTKLSPSATTYDKTTTISSTIYNGKSNSHQLPDITSRTCLPNSGSSVGFHPDMLNEKCMSTTQQHRR